MGVLFQDSASQLLVKYGMAHGMIDKPVSSANKYACSLSSPAHLSALDPLC